MNRNALKFRVALIAFIFSFSASEAQDQVTLTNVAPGAEIGLLVDGKIGNTAVNDQKYISFASPVTIAQFTKATGQATNEIIAFSADRPMELKANVNWTTANNNINVNFSNKILIPVTIWVVWGDFNTIVTKATSDLLTASTIFGNEKVGIDFSTVTFINATQNPMAFNYYDAPSSGFNFSGLKANIGFTNSQINIYYVNTINFSGTQVTNGGLTNTHGGDMIIMGSGTIPPLLTHELGHAFNLYHVTSLSPQYFDSTNVMTQQLRTSTQYFTEGQILRMHLSPVSAINDTYNARGNKPTRTCGYSSSIATNSCPEVQKRIWADGNFVSNAIHPPAHQGDVSRSSIAQQLGAQWLNKACFDEEDNNHLDYLEDHAELTVCFSNIAKHGPDREMLAAERINAGMLYDRNIKVLSENTPPWMNENYIDRIRSISREQFISDQIANLISSYKSRALTALSLRGRSLQQKPGLKFTVYPNPPINQKPTVQYTLENTATNLSFTIFDQMGLKIFDQQYNRQPAGTYKIDLDKVNLPGGIYFFQLNGNGKSLTEKVVIH